MSKGDGVIRAQCSDVARGNRLLFNRPWLLRVMMSVSALAAPTPR